MTKYPPRQPKPSLTKRIAASCYHFYSAHPVQVLLALVLVPTLLVSFGNHSLAGSSTLNYFVGYETGFGGRKLIGTLCHLLFPGPIGKREVFMLIWSANALMVLLFILLCGKAMPRLDRGNMPAVALTVLYLAGPFSLITWISSHASVWMMETYMMVLTLTWLLLFLHHRQRWYYWPLTLAMAVTCCLVHHTYCCLLFPLMVALFAWDSWGTDGRLRAGRAVGYAAICFALLLLFVAIWRFSTMNVDLPTLVERVAARDRSNIAHFPFTTYEQDIWIYYYATNAENVQHNAPLFPYRHLEFALSLILMAPLLVFFCYPLAHASRHAATPSQRWRYGLTLAAVNLLTLPVFFMATDYSRWFYCWFFELSALPLTLWVAGDDAVRNGMASLWNWCTRRWPLALLLLVYAAFCLHPIAHDLDGLLEAIRLRQVITHTSFD